MSASPQPQGFLMMSPAAAAAGVSRATLWRWVVNGLVPEAAIFRVGTRHRIAAWWCAQQRAAAESPTVAR